MEERKLALAQMAESIAGGLYQQDQQNGLERINGLVAELLELAKELERENSSDLNIQTMNRILVEAMKALEVRDYVLLADILFYDLKELLTDEKGNDKSQKSGE